MKNINNILIPNETWLSHKYKNGEINTSIPYISINEPEFYCEGDEADIIIKEIHFLWLNSRYTTEQALNYWISQNLND